MEVSRGLSMASRSLCRSTTSSFLAPLTTLSRAGCRPFSSVPVLFAPRQGGAGKDKAAKEKAKRRKKKHQMYKQYDLKEMEQFTLCDAMRYIKAFEVTHDPDVPKYDIHIKLRTRKDGPVVRNQIRLPHAVKTDIRIAVICPPDSAAAKDARAAGAAVVGEDEVFAKIKEGKIDFDRCLAVPESLPKLAKEGLPRILGPRGLMPSVKLGTVVENPGPAVRNMMGGSMYRERSGVVRMAVGRLSFTPEQLRDNVKAYVNAVKKDAANLSDQIVKQISEVVLSSTNSPGFSLNGEFYRPAPGAPTPRELSVV
ncbi:Large ribosomal subunit protein uL1m [Exophiala dermatitidis]